MPLRRQGQYLTVKAVSYETMALATELTFPPPLADRSGRPEAFEFWWKLLQFVFELPAPTTFPALAVTPEGKDLETLHRYVRAAEEMAESAILAAGDSVTLREDEHGEPRVETNFSSGEVTRGFTTLFRQFDSQKEKASFLRVQRILRVANEASSDETTPTRAEHLRAWAKARGHLRGQNLRVRVGQKLREQGRLGGELPGESGLSPEQLISAYQYGDLIHWGDKKGVLEAVASDPFDQGWQRLAFLDAVVGLTHLYIGFAEVVNAALGNR